jgi:hypothetical protein
MSKLGSRGKFRCPSSGIDGAHELELLHSTAVQRLSDGIPAMTDKDDYIYVATDSPEALQRRACRDICGGDNRQGMFMNSLLSWLANAHYPAPVRGGREWIAATYKDWEKRRPCGKKSPVTARQLRDLVAELVKDGWLLKSRHRSAYHGYKPVLHLAVSDSFREEIKRWIELGEDGYRKERTSSGPTGSQSSSSWQWAVTPTVTLPAVGCHFVVNSYNSLIVGESEDQVGKSEWRRPAGAETSRSSSAQDSDSDSGENTQIDECAEMALSSKTDHVEVEVHSTAVQESGRCPWQVPVGPWYDDNVEE